MTKPGQYDLPQSFDFDLDDGRNLTITITGEGIIMDVCRPSRWTAQYPDEHLGTAGMMFDEWADWAVDTLPSRMRC